MEPSISNLLFLCLFCDHTWMFVAKTGPFAAPKSPQNIYNKIVCAHQTTKKLHARDARLLLPSSLLISAFNIDKMENTLTAYEIFIMCVNKWYKFFSSVILKDNFHVGILEILRGHTKLITTLTSFPLSPSCITCVTCNKNHIYNILEGENARARSLTKLYGLWQQYKFESSGLVILVTSK